MSLLSRFTEILQSLSSDSSTSSSAPVIKQYLVAYSGGLDSHLLLHLCARASELPVRAVHIHHGLQNQADHWSVHCAEVCAALHVPFKTIHVDARKNPGESPEETARKARYRALKSELQAGECLLTAHHQDDQSETVLLQLFRGAGVAGLAAMPLMHSTDHAFHARPLLSFSRQEIHDYANEIGLQWIEDPSNTDTDFDRNLLRQNIIPVIKKRWPQLGDSLSKVASQQQDVLEIIEAMAAIDLSTIISPPHHSIDITGLIALSQARQLNVLRYWLLRYADDAPTANVLHQIIQTVLPAAEDARPEVRWGRSEIRRYQGRLFCLKQIEHDASKIYEWLPRNTLVIENLGVELQVEQGVTKGLKPELLDKALIVAFRQGGEKIQPVGRNTHSLKKLMQEAGIPPWQRSRIPLIYLNNELICVAGYWVASNYSVEQGNKGWQITYL